MQPTYNPRVSASGRLPLSAVRSAVVVALVGAFLGVAAGSLAADGDRAREIARAVERRQQALIARLEASVVTIAVRRDDVLPDGVLPRQRDERPGPVLGSGSGVIISERGHILTNEHVVADAKTVLIGLADGRSLEARVLGRDRTGDLAVAKLPEDVYAAVALGDSDALRVGERVLAMGDPFGLSRDNTPAASIGIVSGLHRYQGGSRIYGDAIQVDAALNPGNSGGPLFNMRGELIGINGRISIRGGERVNVGVGFAVSINQIKLVLDEMTRGRDVRHAFLGVRFRLENTDSEGGVIIEEVLPATSAARAGLRAGDRVLEFEGRMIRNPTRFQNYISVLPAGRKIGLVIKRGEELIAKELVLGPRPEPR